MRIDGTSICCAIILAQKISTHEYVTGFQSWFMKGDVNNSDYFDKNCNMNECVYQN